MILCKWCVSSCVVKKDMKYVLFGKLAIYLSLKSLRETYCLILIPIKFPVFILVLLNITDVLLTTLPYCISSWFLQLQQIKHVNLKIWHQDPHMLEKLWYLSFWVWLFSFIVHFSSFFDLPENFIILCFLQLNTI